jgi:hypothetical protein
MSLIQGWVSAGRLGRKERPILFSSEMVRAILDNRKTQTRRVVASRHPIEFLGGRGQENDLSAWGWFFDGPEHHGYAVLARGMDERRDHGCVSIPCPYGQPGDRLWVRETWRTAANLDHLSPRQIAKKAEDAGWAMPWCPIEYEADKSRVNWDAKMWGPAGKTRVSIHMPRWASRLTLEVTEVRVQRLQDISENDAEAEGIERSIDDRWPWRNYEREGAPFVRASSSFMSLWDSINGERPGCSWGYNPWVWAVSFKVAH